MRRRVSYRLIAALGALALTACAADVPRELPTAFVLPTDSPPAEVTASVAESDPLPLAFWQAQPGDLSDGPQAWQFEAQAGDAIRLRARGENGHLSLMLIAPDGETLTDGGTLTLTAPLDGLYTAIVSAADSERPASRYEIGLSYTDRPDPAAITPTPLPEIVGVPTPVPVYAQTGAFISRLQPGETLGREFDADGPDHIYTFEGRAGTYAEIDMVRVSGDFTPRLTLYDPVGQPIATDGGSGGRGALLFNMRLETDGLYSLQAGGDASGSYSIRLLQHTLPVPVTPQVDAVPTAAPVPTLAALTPSPAVPNNRLERYTPVIGRFDGPGQVAIYPLAAAAGETITIGAASFGPDGVPPRLEVVGPDGDVLALAVAGALGVNDAVVPALAVPVTGVYRVFVTAADSSASGAYWIGYGGGAFWRDVLRGDLPRDERMETALAAPGLRDVWTLELRAGDVITAAVNPGPGSLLDPVLDLAPADDPQAVLAADSDSGGGRSAYIRSVAIPASGLYTLRVWAAQGASSGDYVLIWRYINVAPTPTPPLALALVLTVRDSVPDGEYRFYTFQGRAGQRVRVRVEAQPGSGFDPVAALLGPDGDLLIEVDDVDDDLNPSFIFQLPQDGSYNVRVNGYLTGGPFTVYVETVF